MAQDVASQQTARRLTRQLVADVLDLQLRHLDENNLQTAPIHGEVRRMRDQLDALVEGPMSEVVALLAEAEAAEGDARAGLRQQAATAARRILADLIAQRRLLQLRLAALNLAADAKQVHAAQEQLIARTEQAARLGGVDRELRAIELADQQRAVATLADALRTRLEETSRQNIELSETANEMLTAWRQSRLDESMTAAAAALELGGAEPSLAHQRQAEQALRRALSAAEANLPEQAAARPDPLADTLNGLIARQQELRARVGGGLPNDQAAEAATREQAELAAEMKQVRADLPDDAELQAASQRAVERSEAAADALFQRNTTTAAEEQAAALAAMRDLAEALPEGAAGEPSQGTAGESQSSQQLQQAAADAEKLADYLARLAELPQQVARENPDDPAAVAEAQEFLADKLNKVGGARDWRPPLDEALRQAEQAAAEAAQAAPAEAARKNQAAGENLAAAQQAAEQMAEASRQEAAAARFGELSRAADALDRATAAEQQIADRPAAASWDAPMLNRDAQQQQTIRNMSQHLAESLQRDAPQLADELRAAGDAVEQLGGQLQQAAATAAQQGDASAEQKDTLQQQAAAAAEQLNRLAKQVRQQMHRTATGESALADDQRQAMQQAAVEQHRSREQLRSAQAATAAAPQQAGSPAGEQAQRQLAEAAAQYAAAQQAGGELASQLAGQAHVGDAQIRAALDEASRLNGRAGQSGQPADHGYIPADANETARQVAGLPAGEGNAGNSAEQPPANPQNGMPGEGGEANPQGQPNQPGQPGSSEPGSGEPTESQGGNQQGDPAGDSQPGESQDGATTPPGERSSEEFRRRAVERTAPWLLKLPPEVRESIRASASEPPPPGYEDRLQRYFESLE
ncbi:MAG: hypothetical protein WD030_09805 [Pirellulales bacterium]